MVLQTTTVTCDPARTNIAALTGWVRDCGPLRPRLPRHIAGSNDITIP